MQSKETIQTQQLITNNPISIARRYGRFLPVRRGKLSSFS
jgi:hypothetical protein